MHCAANYAMEAASSQHWNLEDIAVHCLPPTEDEVVAVAKRYLKEISRRSDNHVCGVCGIVGLDGYGRYLSVKKFEMHGVGKRDDDNVGHDRAPSKGRGDHP